MLDGGPRAPRARLEAFTSGCVGTIPNGKVVLAPEALQGNVQSTLDDFALATSTKQALWAKKIFSMVVDDADPGGSAPASPVAGTTPVKVNDARMLELTSVQSVSMLARDASIRRTSRGAPGKSAPTASATAEDIGRVDVPAYGTASIGARQRGPNATGVRRSGTTSSSTPMQTPISDFVKRSPGTLGVSRRIRLAALDNLIEHERMRDAGSYRVMYMDKARDQVSDITKNFGDSSNLHSQETVMYELNLEFEPSESDGSYVVFLDIPQTITDKAKNSLPVMPCLGLLEHADDEAANDSNIHLVHILRAFDVVPDEAVHKNTRDAFLQAYEAVGRAVEIATGDELDTERLPDFQGVVLQSGAVRRSRTHVRLRVGTATHGGAMTTSEADDRLRTVDMYRATAQTQPSVEKRGDRTILSMALETAPLLAYSAWPLYDVSNGGNALRTAVEYVSDVSHGVAMPTQPLSRFDFAKSMQEMLDGVGTTAVQCVALMTLMHSVAIDSFPNPLGQKGSNVDVSEAFARMVDLVNEMLPVLKRTLDALKTTYGQDDEAVGNSPHYHDGAFAIGDSVKWIIANAPQIVAIASTRHPSDQSTFTSLRANACIHVTMITTVFFGVPLWTYQEPDVVTAVTALAVNMDYRNVTGDVAILAKETDLRTRAMEDSACKLPEAYITAFDSIAHSNGFEARTQRRLAFDHSVGTRLQVDNDTQCMAEATTGIPRKASRSLSTLIGPIEDARRQLTDAIHTATTSSALARDASKFYSLVVARNTTAVIFARKACAVAHFQAESNLVASIEIRADEQEEVMYRLKSAAAVTEVVVSDMCLLHERWKAIAEKHTYSTYTSEVKTEECYKEAASTVEVLRKMVVCLAVAASLIGSSELDAFEPAHGTINELVLGNVGDDNVLAFLETLTINVPGLLLSSIPASLFDPRYEWESKAQDPQTRGIILDALRVAAHALHHRIQGRNPDHTKERMAFDIMIVDDALDSSELDGLLAQELRAHGVMDGVRKAFAFLVSAHGEFAHVAKNVDCVGDLMCHLGVGENARGKWAADIGMCVDCTDQCTMPLARGLMDWVCQEALALLHPRLVAAVCTVAAVALHTLFGTVGTTETLDVSLTAHLVYTGTRPNAELYEPPRATESVDVTPDYPGPVSIKRSPPTKPSTTLDDVHVYKPFDLDEHKPDIDSVNCTLLEAAIGVEYLGMAVDAHMAKNRKHWLPSRKSAIVAGITSNMSAATREPMFGPVPAADANGKGTHLTGVHPVSKRVVAAPDIKGAHVPFSPGIRQRAPEAAKSTSGSGEDVEMLHAARTVPVRGSETEVYTPSDPSLPSWMRKGIRGDAVRCTALLGVYATLNTGGQIQLDGISDSLADSTIVVLGPRHSRIEAELLSRDDVNSLYSALSWSVQTSEPGPPPGDCTFVPDTELRLRLARHGVYWICRSRGGKRLGLFAIDWRADSPARRLFGITQSGDADITVHNSDALVRTLFSSDEIARADPMYHGPTRTHAQRHDAEDMMHNWHWDLQGVIYSHEAARVDCPVSRGVSSLHARANGVLSALVRGAQSCALPLVLDADYIEAVRTFHTPPAQEEHVTETEQVTTKVTMDVSSGSTDWVPVVHTLHSPRADSDVRACSLALRAALLTTLKSPGRAVMATTSGATAGEYARSSLVSRIASLVDPRIMQMAPLSTNVLNSRGTLLVDMGPSVEMFAKVGQSTSGQDVAALLMGVALSDGTAALRERDAATLDAQDTATSTLAADIPGSSDEPFDPQNVDAIFDQGTGLFVAKDSENDDDVRWAMVSTHVGELVVMGALAATATLSGEISGGMHVSNFCWAIFAHQFRRTLSFGVGMTAGFIFGDYTPETIAQVNRRTESATRVESVELRGVTRLQQEMGATFRERAYRGLYAETMAMGSAVTYVAWQIWSVAESRHLGGLLTGAFTGSQRGWIDMMDSFMTFGSLMDMVDGALPRGGAFEGVRAPVVLTGNALLLHIATASMMSFTTQYVSSKGTGYTYRERADAYAVLQAWGIDGLVISFLTFQLAHGVIGMRSMYAQLNKLMDLVVYDGASQRFGGLLKVAVGLGVGLALDTSMSSGLLHAGKNILAHYIFNYPLKTQDESAHTGMFAASAYRLTAYASQAFLFTVISRSLSHNLLGQRAGSATSTTTKKVITWCAVVGIGTVIAVAGMSRPSENSISNSSSYHASALLHVGGAMMSPNAPLHTFVRTINILRGLNPLPGARLDMHKPLHAVLMNPMSLSYIAERVLVALAQKHVVQGVLHRIGFDGRNTRMITSMTTVAYGVSALAMINSRTEEGVETTMGAHAMEATAVCGITWLLCASDDVELMFMAWYNGLTLKGRPGSVAGSSTDVQTPLFSSTTGRGWTGSISRLVSIAGAGLAAALFFKKYSGASTEWSRTQATPSRAVEFFMSSTFDPESLRDAITYSVGGLVSTDNPRDRQTVGTAVLRVVSSTWPNLLMRYGRTVAYGAAALGWFYVQTSRRALVSGSCGTPSGAEEWELITETDDNQTTSIGLAAPGVDDAFVWPKDIPSEARNAKLLFEPSLDIDVTEEEVRAYWKAMDEFALRNCSASLFMDTASVSQLIGCATQAAVLASARISEQLSELTMKVYAWDLVSLALAEAAVCAAEFALPRQQSDTIDATDAAPVGTWLGDAAFGKYISGEAGDEPVNDAYVRPSDVFRLSLMSERDQLGSALTASMTGPVYDTAEVHDMSAYTLVDDASMVAIIAGAKGTEAAQHLAALGIATINVDGSVKLVNMLAMHMNMDPFRVVKSRRQRVRFTYQLSATLTTSTLTQLNRALVTECRIRLIAASSYHLDADGVARVDGIVNAALDFLDRELEYPGELIDAIVASHRNVALLKDKTTIASIIAHVAESGMVKTSEDSKDIVYKFVMPWQVAQVDGSHVLDADPLAQVTIPLRQRMEYVQQTLFHERRGSGAKMDQVALWRGFAGAVNSVSYGRHTRPDMRISTRRNADATSRAWRYNAPLENIPFLSRNTNSATTFTFEEDTATREWHPRPVVAYLVGRLLITTMHTFGLSAIASISATQDGRQWTYDGSYEEYTSKDLVHEFITAMTNETFSYQRTLVITIEIASAPEWFLVMASNPNASQATTSFSGHADPFMKANKEPQSFMVSNTLAARELTEAAMPLNHGSLPGIASMGATLDALTVASTLRGQSSARTPVRDYNMVLLAEANPKAAARALSKHEMLTNAAVGYVDSTTTRCTATPSTPVVDDSWALIGAYSPEGAHRASEALQCAAVAAALQRQQVYDMSKNDVGSGYDRPDASDVALHTLLTSGLAEARSDDGLVSGTAVLETLYSSSISDKVLSDLRRGKVSGHSHVGIYNLLVRVTGAYGITNTRLKNDLARDLNVIAWTILAIYSGPLSGTTAATIAVASMLGQYFSRAVVDFIIANIGMPSKDLVMNRLTRTQRRMGAGSAPNGIALTAATLDEVQVPMKMSGRVLRRFGKAFGSAPVPVQMGIIAGGISVASYGKYELLLWGENANRLASIPTESSTRNAAFDRMWMTRHRPGDMDGWETTKMLFFSAALTSATAMNRARRRTVLDDRANKLVRGAGGIVVKGLGGVRAVIPWTPGSSNPQPNAVLRNVEWFVDAFTIDATGSVSGGPGGTFDDVRVRGETLQRRSFAIYSVLADHGVPTQVSRELWNVPVPQVGSMRKQGKVVVTNTSAAAGRRISGAYYRGLLQLALSRNTNDTSRVPRKFIGGDDADAARDALTSSITSLFAGVTGVAMPLPYGTSVADVTDVLIGVPPTAPVSPTLPPPSPPATSTRPTPPLPPTSPPKTAQPSESEPPPVPPATPPTPLPKIVNSREQAKDAQRTVCEELRKSREDDDGWLARGLQWSGVSLLPEECALPQTVTPAEFTEAPPPSVPVPPPPTNTSNSSGNNATQSTEPPPPPPPPPAPPPPRPKAVSNNAVQTVFDATMTRQRERATALIMFADHVLPLLTYEDEKASVSDAHIRAARAGLRPMLVDGDILSEVLRGEVHVTRDAQTNEPMLQFRSQAAYLEVAQSASMQPSWEVALRRWWTDSYDAATGFRRVPLSVVRDLYVERFVQMHDVAHLDARPLGLDTEFDDAKLARLQKMAGDDDLSLYKYTRREGLDAPRTVGEDTADDESVLRELAIRENEDAESTADVTSFGEDALEVMSLGMAISLATDAIDYTLDRGWREAWYETRPIQLVNMAVVATMMMFHTVIISFLGLVGERVAALAGVLIGVPFVPVEQGPNIEPGIMDGVYRLGATFVNAFIQQVVTAVSISGYTTLSDHAAELTGATLKLQSAAARRIQSASREGKDIVKGAFLNDPGNTEIVIDNANASMDDYGWLTRACVHKKGMMHNETIMVTEHVVEMTALLTIGELRLCSDDIVLSSRWWERARKLAVGGTTTAAFGAAASLAGGLGSIGLVAGTAAMGGIALATQYINYVPTEDVMVDKALQRGAHIALSETRATSFVRARIKRRLSAAIAPVLGPRQMHRSNEAKNSNRFTPLIYSNNREDDDGTPRAVGAYTALFGVHDDTVSSLSRPVVPYAHATVVNTSGDRAKMVHVSDALRGAVCGAYDAPGAVVNSSRLVDGLQANDWSSSDMAGRVSFVPARISEHTISEWDRNRALLVQRVASAFVTSTLIEFAVLCRRGVWLIRNNSLRASVLTPSQAADLVLHDITALVNATVGKSMGVVPPCVVSLRRQGLVELGHMCLVWHDGHPMLPRRASESMGARDANPLRRAFLACAHHGMTDRMLRAENFTHSDDHALDEDTYKVMIDFLEHAVYSPSEEYVRALQLAFVPLTRDYSCPSIDDVLLGCSHNKCTELTQLQTMLTTAISHTVALEDALMKPNKQAKLDRVAVRVVLERVVNASTDAASRWIPTVRSRFNALLPRAATKTSVYDDTNVRIRHESYPRR